MFFSPGLASSSHPPDSTFSLPTTAAARRGGTCSGGSDLYRAISLKIVCSAQTLKALRPFFSDATFLTLHQASTPWRGSRAIVRVKLRRFRGADILGLTIVARSRVLFESPAFVCTSGWAATAGTTSSREKREGPHPVSPGPSDLRLLPRIACGLTPASGNAGPGRRQPRRPARPFEQRVAGAEADRPRPAEKQAHDVAGRA
jgi:hypothetical protein